MLKILQNAYGTEARSRVAVFWWWKRLETKWCLMTLSGRPGTVVTDVDTDNTEHLLEEDRRVSLRESSGSLNVSLERVDHIIRMELCMNRVCAMWVPHCLNDEEKRKREESCQRNVIFVRKHPNILSSIITWDESWTRYYDPESK
jgi:hypothetical protein